TGCITSGPESEWMVLDSAESVNCGDWPQALEDLRIDNISVLRGQQPGLFVTGVNREGNSIHYFLDFENDVDIEREMVKPLRFGLGSVLSGSATFGGKKTAVIGRDKSDKSSLAVRDVKSNAVQF